MNGYRPIDCDLHDYLEIACLYRYRLHIELTDGTCLEGNAITTLTTANKEEYLLIEMAEMCREIRLDRLCAVTPLMVDAAFGTILFTARKAEG